MPTSRRKFISQLAGTSVVSGLILPDAIAAPFSPSRTISAADKINIALIGCKGMGFYDLENAMKQPGVECVALCDIDDEVLTKRTADVQRIQGKAPVTYKDFRKVMDDKTIDAVIIGTPDHWHCLPFIAACQAGKDVYVEKPLANSIAECDQMVKATRKYNRVVQVGQQQRSGPHWKKAMELIQSGGIGQLRRINVWGNFNYGIGQPKVPDSPVPKGVDFDMWLGPAPQRSFNSARFHGSWRMFWDYGGGLVTDWGVHLLDMALWATNTTTLPLSVAATGGNFAFADHAHETFDTMDAVFQMKDHVIRWEHNAGLQQGPYGRLYGLAFVGNDATLVADRGGYELFPETDNGKYKVPAIPKQSGSESHELHMKNFIECVRSRKDPACPIEAGRLVAAYAHMANIALRTKSSLVWDPDKNNFGNNAAANTLIRPKYRSPWVFPAI
jgi:predicted dehydrogenase